MPYLEEHPGEDNEYLVWKQYENIFAAVSRYNVVTFWNTITGKQIYRAWLQGNDAICEDAYMYRAQDNQSRY